MCTMSNWPAFSAVISGHPADLVHLERWIQTRLSVVGTEYQFCDRGRMAYFPCLNETNDLDRLFIWSDDLNEMTIVGTERDLPCLGMCEAITDEFPWLHLE